MTTKDRIEIVALNLSTIGLLLLMGAIIGDEGQMVRTAALPIALAVAFWICLACWPKSPAKS